MISKPLDAKVTGNVGGEDGDLLSSCVNCLVNERISRQKSVQRFWTAGSQSVIGPFRVGGWAIAGLAALVRRISRRNLIHRH